MRLYVALATLVVALLAGLMAADYQWDREQKAEAVTLTFGLSPERQCALARPLVRVPIPWRVECYRSETPGVSWGSTQWTDGRRAVVDHIEIHLTEGISVERAAELIGHEVGHGYTGAVTRGNDDPSDDWVVSHEPYADHWGRCVTTRTAPC